jgi:hypothetical protein
MGSPSRGGIPKGMCHGTPAVLPHYGLVVACVGISVIACSVRGVLLWWFGCRLLKVPLGLYVRRVFVPVGAVAALPMFAAYAAGRWLRPDTWLELLELAGAYTVVFAAVLGPFLLGRERLRTAAAAISSRDRER